jgi:NAD(P)-dependent dehydrogenase (short-subunit alcohol dehydrogenase family)
MASKRPQVVVVTGASAGVGRATAREFAKRGAHIGLIARGREGLEAARSEVETLGGQAHVEVADVADAAQVESAADAIEKTLGPIDVWVNNAMVSVFSPFHEITPEEFRRVTEVTYLGTVYGTMAALKRMRLRDRGVIVQVGSALAHRAIPLQSAYCGAKHAMKGFTESLRCELLHDKSRVALTMVHLPALNTPQFGWVKSRLARKPQPVPPIYQPEVAARAIVWAAAHPRREVNVGIFTSAAVLGENIVPQVVDRYLARTGFDSQQTPEPAQADRPVNLWEPVAGDRGAHGAFDQRAAARSLQLWATTHRRILASMAGVAGAAYGYMKRRRNGRR